MSIEVKDLGCMRVAVTTETVLGDDGKPVLDEAGDPIQQTVLAPLSVNLMLNFDKLSAFLSTIQEDLETKLSLRAMTVGLRALHGDGTPKPKRRRKRK